MIDTIAEWEKEFEKLGWAFDSEGGYEKVISFIRTLLTQAHQEGAQEVRDALGMDERIQSVNRALSGGVPQSRIGRKENDYGYQGKNKGNRFRFEGKGVDMKPIPNPKNKKRLVYRGSDGRFKSKKRKSEGITFTVGTSAFGVEYANVNFRLDMLEEKVAELMKHSYSVQDWHCSKCGGNFDRWNFNALAGLCDKCVAELHS